MRSILLTIGCCLLLGSVAARAELRPAERDRKDAPAPAGRSSQPDRNGDNPAAKPDTPVEGPHLRLEHATHDFGDVPRRSENLTHEFSFTNDGTKPLVLTRVLTSCSCLKAAFPKRPVPPGQQGTIRITYEPFKSEPGTFNKVIQIYSNSVDGREILTVQGTSLDERSEPKPKNVRLKTQRNNR